MGEWGLACLGISHGPCDGAAGDGLVPLVGLRYLLLARGSCLVSEVSSGLGKHLSLRRKRGREERREGRS